MSTTHAFARNIVFAFSARCPKCNKTHEYNANIDDIYFSRICLEFYDGDCALINLECPHCREKLSVNFSLDEYIGIKRYKNDKFSPTIDSTFSNNVRNNTDN